MGKAGKARKRQRLEGSTDAGVVAVASPSPTSSPINEEKVAISTSLLDLLGADLALYASKGYKMLRKLLFPLVQVQLDKHFEEATHMIAMTKCELSEVNMKALEHTINYFVNNLEVFQSQQYKQFRRSLHPLVLYTKKNMNGTVAERSDQSISNQISTAFRCSNYCKVYGLLLQLTSRSDESIKLGHLQRWTRECDLMSKPHISGDYTEPQLKNMSLLLLYAVLRVMSNRSRTNCAFFDIKLSENNVEMDSMKAAMVTHPYFSAVDEHPSDDCILPAYDNRNCDNDIVVIRTTPGHERRPPRHEVPHVPGAFILTNVLTPRECWQFISIAEQIKYTPDAVDGIDNIQWLASDDIIAHLFSRCQSLLPAVIPSMNGDFCVLQGINARLRLFRYTPGSVYRPHIDGAWPGSGLVDGCFSDDAFGDRLSKLTFLVYLNDGFAGGGTTFFLPDDEINTINAYSVQPKRGCVLCFPHGQSMESLVHEGSAVCEGGVKYIIRSDVLYSK